MEYNLACIDYPSNNNRTYMQTTHSMPSSKGGWPTQSLAGGQAEEGKASWTDSDVNCLIQFLVDNKAAAGDGGDFKKAIWMAAALYLKDSTTKGAVKTAGLGE
jgi:hypothetical protein